MNPDVLWAVLVHLPVHEVASARLVCKAWRTAGTAALRSREQLRVEDAVGNPRQLGAALRHNMPSLHSLDLHSECSAECVDGLAPLIPWLSSLSLFEASDHALARLPPSPQLRTLCLWGGDGLTALAPLVDPFPNLRSVRLHDCPNVHTLAPLARLPHLAALYLLHGTAVRTLGALAGARSLRTLHVGVAGTSSGVFHDVALLKGLTELVVAGCQEANVFPLSGLARLRVLRLEDCRSVHDVAMLRDLVDLRELAVTQSAVTDLAPIAHLQSLTSLTLTACPATALPSRLPPSLTSLSLHSCFRLTSLDPLRTAPHVKSLDLSLCKALTDFSPLASLGGLRSLSVAGVSNPLDWSVDQLPGLTRLDLSWCRTPSLAPVASLVRLTSLSLSSSMVVKDLAPLASLRSLTSLDLAWCTRVASVQALEGLTALVSLTLSRCSVFDLAPLRAMRCLERLDLSFCARLSNIAPLCDLKALRVLNLEGCLLVRDVAPVQGLPFLHSFTTPQSPFAADRSRVVPEEELVEEPGWLCVIS